ncbi:hypothetical protein BZZ01_03170 [Nostocales cyanobacterium HT-58-2]|nr:hypothetical protein BZZ01_03170 [Nostocales cyanobacterium HT-58-2]
MAPIIVETPYGKVQGIQEESVQIFKGIPFAQPPVNKLRYRPPQPCKPWVGVLEALSFGAITPQPSIFDTLPPLPQNEDCLYLNVWAPVDPGSYPVMVWIHGGEFFTGRPSELLFDGSVFAKEGIVTITIAYRLGVLGFLHLPHLLGDEFATSGTLGLQDQIAALKWVQQAIPAFGGDPHRVVVAGQAAGGSSIGTLIAMPDTEGLFRAGILQSGAANKLHDRDTAAWITAFILNEFSLAPNQAYKLLELPVEELVAASQRMIRKIPMRAPFRPVVDGITLPTYPLEAIAHKNAKLCPSASAKSANVSLLVGTNRDEMNTFAMIDLKSVALEPRNSASLDAISFVKVVEQYRIHFKDLDDTILASRLLTASEYWIPAIRLVEAHTCAGGTAWMYRFDWTHTIDSMFGAGHTFELPLVWQKLDLSFDDPIGTSKLGALMHKVWVQFITTGNPNGAGLSTWLPYHSNERTTMIFDEPMHIENDPNASERKLWDNISLTSSSSLN